MQIEYTNSLLIYKNAVQKITQNNNFLLVNGYYIKIYTKILLKTNLLNNYNQLSHHYNYMFLVKTH